MSPIKTLTINVKYQDLESGTIWKISSIGCLLSSSAESVKAEINTKVCRKVFMSTIKCRSAFVTPQQRLLDLQWKGVPEMKINSNSCFLQRCYYFTANF